MSGNCNCYICQLTTCDKKCCIRCQTADHEIVLNQRAHNAGFYKGSRFVDRAYREGLIRGKEKVWFHWKFLKAKHNIPKEKRAIIQELMDLLEADMRSEIEETNEWLKENDEHTEVIRLIIDQVKQNG